MIINNINDVEKVLTSMRTRATILQTDRVFVCVIADSYRRVFNFGLFGYKLIDLRRMQT